MKKVKTAYNPKVNKTDKLTDGSDPCKNKTHKQYSIAITTYLYPPNNHHPQLYFTIQQYKLTMRGSFNHLLPHDLLDSCLLDR